MGWNSIVFDGLKQGAKGESPDDDLERYRNHPRNAWERLVFRCWEKHVRKISRYRDWGQSQDHRHMMYHRASPAGPTHHHVAIATAAVLSVWFEGAFLFYFAWAILGCNAIMIGALHLTKSHNTATAT